MLNPPALKLSLGQILFKDFAAEVSDRTIGPDRASPYGHYVLIFFVEWNFDVGILTSFFGEDLDAYIVVFMGSVDIVIPIHLSEQDNRRRPWRHGFARHVELFGRWRLECRACLCLRRRRKADHERRNYPLPETEHGLLSFSL